MSGHPKTVGFNHVATMTSDLDRYLAFYQKIFGAEVVSVMEAEGDHPKMAIVNMGGNSALNVFEVPADSIVGNRGKMGGRGPIDHYAFAVESEKQLLEIRDRLVESRGVTGGRHSVRARLALCLLSRPRRRRARGRLSRRRGHGGRVAARIPTGAGEARLQQASASSTRIASITSAAPVRVAPAPA